MFSAIRRKFSREDDPLNGGSGEDNGEEGRDGGATTYQLVGEGRLGGVGGAGDNQRRNRSC